MNENVTDQMFQVPVLKILHLPIGVSADRRSEMSIENLRDDHHHLQAFLIHTYLHTYIIEAVK